MEGNRRMSQKKLEQELMFGVDISGIMNLSEKNFIEGLPKIESPQRVFLKGSIIVIYLNNKFN